MASGNLMRVALTGGIASGKSTVASLFSEQGVPVIDLDEIARDVVAPGSALLARVLERFGHSLRSSDGTLDRRALRAIVFRDPGARAELEALLHPAILARAAQRAAAATGPYLIIVIPLLVESGRVREYDRVLLVDCDERLQRERLARRDRSDEELIDAALKTQASRAARAAVADDLIVNDSTPGALAPRVRELHAQYLELARRR